MAYVSPDTIANIIIDLFLPGITNLVWVNDILFRGPPGTPEGNKGGLFPVYEKGTKAHKKALKVAGRTAQNYVSGQALPEGEYITWTSATFVDEYVRTTLDIDRRTWDKIDPTDAMRVEEAISEETSDCHEAIQREFHDIFLGTGGVAGNTGILSAIDNVTEYAGVNRGSYSGWGSYVDDTAAALARSDLEDTVSAVTGEGRGAKKQDLVIGISEDQMRAYRALPGDGTSGVEIHVPAGGVLDLGFIDERFDNIPMVTMQELDSGTFLVMDMSVIYFAIMRPLMIHPIASSEDADKFQLSTAVRFVVEDPKRCGKREGLT